MVRPPKFALSELYPLPLESGTRRLCANTLKRHSSFAGTKIHRRLYKVTLQDYVNEYLVIMVSFKNQAPQRVYLKVTLDQLLVGCTAGTDGTFLSLHAYLALENLTFVNSYFDFEKYHWPGFFDPKTGRSKYLNIINDRKGFDVILKEKYRHLIKPGSFLFFPDKEDARQGPNPVEPGPAPRISASQQIGFCLAETQLRSCHSNHFPLLKPYMVVPTADGKRVKSFGQFLSNPPEQLSLSPAETQLFQIAEQMLKLAPLATSADDNARHQVEDFEQNHFKQFAKLFELWQQAIGPLSEQVHTHYLYTYGLNNLKVGPKKHKMSNCSFSTTPIKICFQLTENIDHYQLQYLFKLEDKCFVPSLDSPAFFMRKADAPERIYLHCCLQDCLLSLFFSEKRYNLCILKAHYKDYFAPFVNSLRTSYEFIL